MIDDDQEVLWIKGGMPGERPVLLKDALHTDAKRTSVTRCPYSTKTISDITRPCGRVVLLNDSKSKIDEIKLQRWRKQIGKHSQLNNDNNITSGTLERSKCVTKVDVHHQLKKTTLNRSKSENRYVSSSKDIGKTTSYVTITDHLSTSLPSEWKAREKLNSLDYSSFADRFLTENDSTVSYSCDEESNVAKPAKMKTLALIKNKIKTMMIDKRKI